MSDRERGKGRENTWTYNRKSLLKIGQKIELTKGRLSQLQLTFIWCFNLPDKAILRPIGLMITTDGVCLPNFGKLIVKKLIEG